MGTTADKLNKILETKQAIRQAIITKGVEVGEDTKFADYPSKIAAIQTGSSEGSSDAFFNLRTDNGTNFSNLFYCYGGSELDFSGWDTSQANTMNDMFSYCTSLTSLNMSGFNTSNVTNMASMFNTCYSLSSLDVSSFDTSNVTNMAYMFSYCYGLQSLSLSNFNTDNVYDMYYMFDNCHNLQSLDLSNFRTSQLQNTCGMFTCCNNLEEVNMSNFDMTIVSSYDEMFSGCDQLRTLRLDNCSYDTINKIINSSNFPTGTVNGEMREIYCTENNSASIEQLPDGWKFVHVESSEGGEPGGGMPGIPGTDGPEIAPDPTIPEEPSEPTETYAISFSTLGSKKLTVNNVDVTDQVVETGGYGDTISCKYETTDVIRQASFKDNTDLVRVFGLDTSMMFHTEEMFSGCTNLVAVLPVLDSGMAYSTRAMFKNCTSLTGTSLDNIGSFTAATDKSEMFYNCSSLTGTVDANSYWNNAMVSDYSNCFYNCTSLDNYSDIPASWGGPDDSE